MKSLNSLKTISLFLVALVLPGILQAVPIPKEKEGIMIRIVATAQNSRAPLPDLAVRGVDGELVPVQMFPWGISPAVKQKMGSRVQLYNRAALKEAIDGGTPLPDPVLEIPLQPGTVSCLIVLRADKQAKGSSELVYEVYDDSPKVYPGGSRMFLNLSPYRLTGTCAGANFVVPPRGSTLFNPGVKSEDYREQIQLYAELPTRKALSLDEVWVFSPDSRGIILVFETEGSIRVVSISDQIPPEPPKPEVVKADKKPI